MNKIVTLSKEIESASKETATTITNIRCYVVEEQDTVPQFDWRPGVPGGFSDGTPDGQTPHVAYIRVDTVGGVTGCIRKNRGDSVASIVPR